MIGTNLQTKSAYNTNRLIDSAVWGYYNPYRGHIENPAKWFYWFDDFHNVGDLSGGSTAATDGLQQNYATYIDTSDTVRALATEKMRGVLRLSSAATDNNAPVITMQGNRGTSVMFDDNSAPDNKLLLHQCRWRKSSITANQASIFHGLVEEARAVNDGVLTDDTGAIISTIDAVGFNVLQTDGSLLDFLWQTASQATQKMSSIISTTNSASAALVASTWYKTGFVYNPKFGTDRRIKVIVNGVEYTTYVTAANMAAATFPDGEELTFAACLKNGEATACTFDLDWVLLVQELLDT